MENELAVPWAAHVCEEETESWWVFWPEFPSAGIMAAWQRPSGVKGILSECPLSSKHQRFPFVHQELAGKPVFQEAETH